MKARPRPSMCARLRIATLRGSSGGARKTGKILAELDVFWTPHADADDRFGNWMRRCQTMNDRDMLVCGTPEALDGYVIAQPASRLHFPPAHDIRATGVRGRLEIKDCGVPCRPLNGGKGWAVASTYRT
ncbi:hypothetical protein BOSEA31B_13291 [Hyphomicrobiales bacterium]|nr:hypothetical protein BOSEA31B_13291 [Hyphomicrobiales bacterium]